MTGRVLLLMMVVLLTGCGVSVPADKIQPDEMENILLDYHVAMAMAERNVSDVAYEKVLLKNEVLKKYGVTQAMLDSSLIYYMEHTKLMEKIYRNIHDRLAEDAKKYGASKGEVNTYATVANNSDTANIWRDESDMVLMSYPPYNRLSFSISADTSFYSGDTFLWGMNIDFIIQEGKKEGVASLALCYEDTIIVNNIHISSSGIREIRTRPREKVLKSIQGFIYLSDGGGVSQTVKLMFLGDIQLIRMHRGKKIKKEAERETAPSDTADSAALKSSASSKPIEVVHIPQRDR